MRTILLLLVVILAASVGDAQWFWQNPLPQGNNLWSADFVNASQGWVVGSHGTILKTTDGGVSWIDQESGTTLDLKWVWFLNNTTGWAVGDSGIVLKTTNSGNIWNIQRIGVNDYAMLAVHFVDANTGWAVGGNLDIGGGGTILHTTNGGSEWIPQDHDTVSILCSVFFVDHNNGWAVGGWAMGDSTVLHTTDGGNSWSSEIGPVYCNTVTFSDSQHGWIVGTDYIGWSGVGKILRTTDGGMTWDGMPYSGLPTISASFANENTGWTIDDQSQIRKTTDGGNTWSDQPSGTLRQLMSLSSVDSSTACIVGIGGIILTTTSGGNNWITRSTGAHNNGLLSVDFVDTENGWAVGVDAGLLEPTLCKTTNGGVIWTSSYIPIIYARDLSFVDANTGWVVGSNGAMIIKTTDGGISWSTQYQGNVNNGESLWSVYFVNQNVGWAVGHGSINTFPYVIALRTADGGSNWLSMTLPGTSVTGVPMAVYFVDANTGWIVGSGTSIFKTTNGGTSWLFQPSGLGFPYPEFTSVHFIDTNTGWIVGQNGAILKTSNGGINWNVQSFGTQNDLWSVDFTDANNGWAGGSGILHTTNGGEHWSDQISPTTHVGGVNFVDQNNGWAVGGNGTILHTTNGGLTFVEGERREEVPTQFALEQNYPNPFNPVTNFQFSIVNRQLTILKVYDVLGREVATLVNEVKQPGTYTVRWDASGFASGIYFYKLQAGNFIDVKKLILLR